MKTIVLTLTAVGMFTTSCNKDDKNSGGPGVQIPDIGLVAPEGFKNTAKNGAEVASHLSTSSESTGKVSFGRPQNLPSPTPPTSLDRGDVSAFLAGDDTFGNTPLSMPRVGTDCGSSLNVLQSVYQTTSSTLRSAADALVQLDSSSLPDGVTREPASEQFAVSYAIDLSKMQQESSDERSGSLPSGSIPSGLTLSAQPSQSANFSGLARVGAGANADVAIVGLGVNVAVTGERDNANGNGGFLVAAYTKEQKLKFNLNSALNAVVTDNQGQTHSSNATIGSNATLIAGSLPSVELSLKGNGNATLAGGDSSVSGDSRPTIIMDGKDHSIDANFKVEKLSNNDIKFTMAMTADGNTQKQDLILTSDENGNCVVKNP
jgi:hypothetical protein